ncbi:MAG: insulinase family protein [bacterium]|nr:insulinase family protein [bacterium]
MSARDLFRLVMLAFATTFCVSPSAGSEIGRTAEATLDNGLRVLVRAMPAEPLVSIEMFYAAGSAAEPDSLAGLAHLAEHLLFEGDKDAGGHWLCRRQALLALHANASTSPPVMTFESQCLPAFLPLLLELEAERMRGIHPDSLVFERERRVVLEEAAYRGWRETSPDIAAFQAGFPGHPYGRAAIGTAESIRRITLADLEQFCARTIQPAAAALVIDGPIDPVATLDLVRARFAAIPAGAPPAPLPEYPAAAARLVILDDRDYTGYRVNVSVRVPITTMRDLALVDLAVAFLNEETLGANLTLIPGAAVVAFPWRGPYYEPKARFDYLEELFDADRDVQNSLGWFWERLDQAARALTSSSRSEEMKEWLADAAAKRVDNVMPRKMAGTGLLAGLATPSPLEYGELVAGIGLADLRAFIGRHLVVENSAIAVGHGSDSRRIARQQLAGRVVPDHGIDAADPLGDLTASEIEPVLRACGDADILALRLLKLDNGIPVVCRHAPGDTEWQLTGWRRGEPVAAARPGKRPGICYLYERTAAYDPAPTAEGRRPKPWAFGATFSLAADGLYRFAAAGPRDEAASIATSLAARLERDDFNISAWTASLRFGPGNLLNRSRDAGRRASAWRWARIIGADHPAVGEWQPETSALDGIVYKDLQKLHRRATRPTGDLTLLACGGVHPDAVRAVLQTSFGSGGDHEPRKVDAPPAGPDAITGAIFPSPDDRDVTLTLSFAAVKPEPAAAQPGLALMLLSELYETALDARLRQREGWTYHVSCRIHEVSGWGLPEIQVTCQPGQAPAVLSALREELVNVAERGFAEDLIARARLRLVCDLLRSAGDPQLLSGWVGIVSAFGPVPADPVGAALALDPEAPGFEPVRLFPPDRFAFSATGAILEDDLGLFEF